MKASCSVLCMLLSFVPSAWCYTYDQVGVNSNFLVDQGRLYFAQSDGTLTVLNLEGGDVIARNGDIHYGGVLQSVGDGILVSYRRKLTMVKRSSLEIIWQADNAYSPVIEGNRIVSYDGNGLLQCRDLQTGKELWSYDLPGALQFVPETGKLLVFREAVYDGPERNPAVVLLDMESGEVLLHRTTPHQVHFLGAFFDGEKIFLPAGNYKDHQRPNQSRFDSGRRSARFERMLVWDLQGNELESTPVSGEQLKLPHRGDAYEFGNKIFAQNRVWESMDEVPPWLVGRGKQVGHERSEDLKKIIKVTRFTSDDAIVTVTVTSGNTHGLYPDSERTVEVALESDTENWSGNLAYLMTPGEVVFVEFTGELIILGTNLGHVEAVERKTGRSKWMYIFPTKRQTLSYSRYGMPPMMSSAAKTYEKLNKREAPESGLVLAGADMPSNPKVTFDPQPANPYRKLPIYLTIAWASVLFPMGISGYLLYLTRKPNFVCDARIPAALTLLMTMVATTTLFFYGRVSVPTAIGCRVAIALSLHATAFFAFCAIEQKRLLSGGVVMIVGLALAILIFPEFFRL